MNWLWAVPQVLNSKMTISKEQTFEEPPSALDSDAEYLSVWNVGHCV